LCVVGFCFRFWLCSFFFFGVFSVCVLVLLWFGFWCFLCVLVSLSIGGLDCGFVVFFVVLIFLFFFLFWLVCCRVVSFFLLVLEGVFVGVCRVLFVLFLLSVLVCRCFSFFWVSFCCRGWIFLGCFLIQSCIRGFV